jgi:prevent-host-death family protein
MIISVTELRTRCFEIIRMVARERNVVEITRRGAVIARLLPVETDQQANVRPWERLRSSGTLLEPPKQPARSPFDVEGIDLGLKREQILRAIHESRKK